MLEHFGPLSTALLLGLLVRACWPGALERQAGISFAAHRLLRWGIVLLGVRLNFDLVLHAGPKILLLDAMVIVVGVAGITWLGRRCGLDATMAALIAVDSSICGASAVAAAGPALRARHDQMALVIPIGSLLGTAAMLGFTFTQGLLHLEPRHYGVLAGATLQEIAQVMAAVAPVPEAVGAGTVTKLTRVVLLIPVILVLAAWMKQRAGANPAAKQIALPKPWFVAGFVLVGVINTLALHLFPSAETAFAPVQHGALTLATFLMGMAMAGMGLQIDFSQLRKHGARVAGVAVFGWLVLFSLTLFATLLCKW